MKPINSRLKFKTPSTKKIGQVGQVPLNSISSDIISESFNLKLSSTSRHVQAPLRMFIHWN